MSTITISGPLGVDLEPEDAIITSAAANSVGDVVQLSFLAANLTGNRVAKAIAVATNGFTTAAEAVGLAWFGVVVTAPSASGQPMKVRLRGICKANCAAAQTPVDGAAVVLLRPTNAATTLTVCAAGDQAAGASTKAVATPLETTTGAGLCTVYFNGIDGVQTIVGA